MLYVCRPHTSYLDGFAVARWLTRRHAIRGAVFAVDPDFALHPVWSRLLCLYGRLVGGHTMVAIDSRKPFAIRTLMTALKGGRAVVIFPQGTGISKGKYRPDQGGFSWLLRKSDAAHVEVHIQHHRRWWPLVRKAHYRSGAGSAVGDKKMGII
ncbi:MAG: 1-acyl-sn-glycerol-3-phosphate acyltransferase [Acidithiobacillus sp.]|jgi:1-acyl-sn-glycerol-3-phosphate acyltransferase|uniref:1-acyl-sn-glycerol-3-phosphate acyltransferase n=1 Tax=Acidithiobacillus ferrooxidans TaxID=920 RepID=UPI0013D46D49|nr:1-acyl-sn-glycerol-3-phosphate acyltransferase [Acidithiobacillus ferrooxidans]